MIILIDGYNLLRHIFPGVKGDLDKQRLQFIRLLGHYKKKKESVIKEIIVVFDAGPFRHASREIRQGIVVMFSGQNSCADEWIFEYVARHKNHEMVLVTLDRELRERCKPYHVESMDVAQFYHSVKDVLLETIDMHLVSGQSMIERYEKDDLDDFPEVDQEALGLMMQHASIKIEKKDIDNGPALHKQKGVAHKDSKKSKSFNKVLKKIQ